MVEVNDHRFWYIPEISMEDIEELYPTSLLVWLPSFRGLPIFSSSNYHTLTHKCELDPKYKKFPPKPTSRAKKTSTKTPAKPINIAKKISAKKRKY